MYSYLLSIVPSMVLSTPSNRTIEEGLTFNISFEYYAVPPPNFTWYINDVFYKTKIGTTNNGTHTMVFTNASQGGWYRCEIENGFGTDEYSVFISIKGMLNPNTIHLVLLLCFINMHQVINVHLINVCFHFFRYSNSFSYFNY